MFRGPIFLVSCKINSINLLSVGGFYSRKVLFLPLTEQYPTYLYLGLIPM